MHRAQVIGWEEERHAPAPSTALSRNADRRTQHADSPRQAAACLRTTQGIANVCSLHNIMIMPTSLAAVAGPNALDRIRPVRLWQRPHRRGAEGPLHSLLHGAASQFALSQQRPNTLAQPPTCATCRGWRNAARRHVEGSCRKVSRLLAA